MILVRKRFPNDFQEKKISDCVLQSRMQQFILMGLCNISLTEVCLKPSQTSTMDLFSKIKKWLPRKNPATNAKQENCLKCEFT